MISAQLARPHEIYTILIIDDEWHSREVYYREALGSAFHIEFVKSPRKLQQFRNREYDAYIIDVVLDKEEWLNTASKVIELLRPSDGEFSGPIFLVTNAWTGRDAILSEEFTGAIRIGSVVRIFPWKAFDPGTGSHGDRSELIEMLRTSILLEIEHWHGLMGFGVGIHDAIRVLHLFNLRFGARDHGQLAPMSATELARALRRIESGPHLIVVSGNITASGMPSEFDDADRWLSTLASELWPGDTSEERVFVAPGSHDINRILAIAGEYEYVPERRALERSAALANSPRKQELAAFGLAPFQRFSARFMSGRQWGQLGASPAAIVDSRFRRFGIRLFGVSPGIEVDAANCSTLEARSLCDTMARVSAVRDALRVIVGEHGQGLLAGVAQVSPPSATTGPVLLFLSAEGGTRTIVPAIDQPAIVVSGPVPSGDVARGVNLVSISPFEEVTIRMYSCQGTTLVPVGEPVSITLPDVGIGHGDDPGSGGEYSHVAAHGETTAKHEGATRNAERGSKAEASGDVEARSALLVTVTANERKAVLAALTEMGVPVEEKFSAELPRHEFSWPSKGHRMRVWLVRTEDQRSASVAAQVTALRTAKSFEAILMVGMAMGIPGRTKPGDVLVPMEVFSVDHRRATADGLKLIPHPYRPDSVASSRIKSVLDQAKSFSFGVHLKQHACGSVKLEDPDSPLLKEITEISPDIYGYEMEAEGLFVALRPHGVEGLLIKGVADFADAPGGTAAGSEAKQSSQVLATVHALRVAFAFLDHLARFPARA